MTAFALNHLIRETPAFLHRLSQSCSAFFDGIGEARAMAQRYKSLARLTDDQLAQRGLTRADIPQAVLASFRR